MQLIATKEFTFAGVPLKPGDPFRASAEDGRILKGLDKAIDKPLQTAAMQEKQEAVSEGAAESATDKRGKKRSNRYDRRDMRAQE